MNRKSTSAQSPAASPGGPRVPAPRPIRQPFFSLPFLLLLAGAALIRLIWLDRAAFRADTLHFWSMAQQHLSFGDVWSKWLQLMGDSAQFPLAAALAMIPRSWLGLSVSGFSVRLMDALFGVLAVGGAWQAGRMLGGRWFACAFGLFIALNPLHLQLCREAYFYSTLVAGGFILLACTIRLVRFPRLALSSWWKVAWVVGLFLTAYSHFTGWLLAALTVALVVVRLGLNRSDSGARKSVLHLAGLAVLVAVPLTWLPWALPYSISKMSNAASKAEAVRVMGEVKTPVAEMLGGYLSKMMWGTTSWAAVLLAASVFASLALLVLGGRRRVIRWLGGALLAGSGAYLLVMKSQNMYEAVRHVAFLFPLVTLFSFYGLWSLPRIKGVRRACRPAARRTVAWVLMVVGLGVQLPAAWAAIRITGSPTPYKAIHAWSDQHLPRGTPVLVDRWFEPWNELRVQSATQVVYTFTRPNEPLDVFLQTHWRDGAEQFLRRFPDAAYLEIAKSYALEPAVGPWAWPQTYFRQQVRLANEEGLHLRRRGQAFREDFYAADTNRLVIDVFYNTREDVLQMARNEGRAVVAWPGSGWTFVKSGPVAFLPLQTQDFMDWRYMEGSASIELHNLTDQVLKARLKLAALAPRGLKTVADERCGSFTFPPSRFSEWPTKEFDLNPGQTDIVLRDHVSAPAPLLVQQWQVEVLSGPGTAPAAAQAIPPP